MKKNIGSSYPTEFAFQYKFDNITALIRQPRNYVSMPPYSVLP